MMRKHLGFKGNFLFLLIIQLLNACAAETITPPFDAEDTASISPENSITPSPTARIQPQELSISFDEPVPEGLIDQIHSGSPFQIIKFNTEEDFQLIIDQEEGDIEWVFALAAPFPNVIDSISFEKLIQLWNGEVEETEGFGQILVSPNTAIVFGEIWGTPAEQTVAVVDEAELFYEYWGEDGVLAIIPFESIQPQWKVLKIDGVSPFETEPQTAPYPLAVKYKFKPKSERAELSKAEYAKIMEWMPAGNRDAGKLTSVIITGTTALVRNTAKKMEEKGVLYPAQRIKSWFRSADVVHISNEVSFSESCSDPDKPGIRFCSPPEYLELLMDIGTDVVELTGNHLLDDGEEPLLESIDLYESNGLEHFGAGENLEKAREEAVIEHNGNRIAFLGCNKAGPENHFAGIEKPGVASCNREWLGQKIADLKSEGYIVIMAFQHNEINRYFPPLDQIDDFVFAAEAGADIVSGSQAHYPQSISFYKNSFLHYGLGNLFFDQMDEPVAGTRREFIDKHYFYDGKYISTELLTAMLEDYAQPRPMEKEEREELLSNIFKVIQWYTDD